MDRFSFPGIVAKAVGGNKRWRARWPDAELTAEFDVAGAGGHGLGTACSLAKEHGGRRGAVIVEGRLGRTSDRIEVRQSCASHIRASSQR